MWCRAVAPIGLFADQLRRMYVYDLAVLLGDDIAGPEPMLIVHREQSASARAVEVD